MGSQMEKENSAHDRAAQPSYISLFCDSHFAASEDVQDGDLNWCEWSSKIVSGGPDMETSEAQPLKRRVSGDPPPQPTSGTCLMRPHAQGLIRNLMAAD